MQKWVKVKNKIESEEISAENMCNRLKSNPNMSNFIKLEKNIMDADEDWIRDFIGKRGLFLLFECTESLNKSVFQSAIFSSVLISKCLNCIQKLMNSEFGIESLIMMADKEDNYLGIFAKGLLPNTFFLNKILGC